MWAVSAIARAVATAQGFRAAIHLYLQLPLGDREKFTGSVKMRGTTQLTLVLQTQFIELHILFQVQWRQRSNTAGSTGAIVIQLVIGANDINRAARTGVLHQFRDTEPKCMRQLHRGRKGRICRLPLDLADHRTADTTRFR